MIGDLMHFIFTENLPQPSQIRGGNIGTDVIFVIKVTFRTTPTDGIDGIYPMFVYIRSP